MHLRAVRSLLLDDIAPLTRPKSAPTTDVAVVSRARTRAALVAALDWVAILVLFAWRAGEPLLVLGPSEEAIFTLGVLAVAVHSGYRLAQMQTLGAVRVALESLPDESADPTP